MFNVHKSLALAITAMSFAIASTVIPATVFASANPNANGKNANGVERSAKSTQTEPEIDIEEHANEHAKSTHNKPVAITAVASDKGQEKVRICHRTASYSNPYVSITVARAAVDGIAGNSGNEADHYGEHKGPVFNNSLPKHTEWGDIIPALNGGHNGLNWNDAGRTIYNNGCKLSKQAPILLASVKTSDPVSTPVTPVTGQLANTGLNIWATSLISILIIAMSVLFGLISRRKLTIA